METQYKRYFKENKGSWADFIEWAKSLQTTKKFPTALQVSSGAHTLSKNYPIRRVDINDTQYVHFGIDSSNWVRIYKSEFIYGNLELGITEAYIYCKNDIAYMME